MSNQRYMMRGVSASKEDVHNAIKNIDKGIFPKAFCKIIPDILGGDPEYCNIMHADGAGTKSSLAYMYWKETGDLSVWKGIAQDALIMNIDDLLCVGAVDNILVSSTIGRNKLLIPGEVISAIINGTDELLAELREMGVGVYATGGETADVGDLVRTIIVDSTVTCRMKRSDVIDNANIRPGDVIVGLASYGQATYEKEYIKEAYGAEFVGAGTVAKKDDKKVQDAHEAIRPTYMTNSPASIKDELSRDQFRLYQLIWNRFMASRMAPAKYENTSVKIAAGDYRFNASASKIAFDGFLSVYNINNEKSEGNVMLKSIDEDTKLTLNDLEPKQHFTQPPAHYTEASLVKTTGQSQPGGMNHPSKRPSKNQADNQPIHRSSLQSRNLSELKE